ncbi:DUF983 domain-containing protein [soil metagenome]
MGCEDRPVGQSLRRGWSRRCPACGNGALMAGYLTVRDACARCGEDLTPQRANDGPAWATIVVTGKIIAPLMLFVFQAWRPDPLVMALGFSAVFVALSLYLLPRFKGLFVGMQWAWRMHGFGEASGARP